MKVSSIINTLTSIPIGNYRDFSIANDISSFLISNPEYKEKIYVGDKMEESLRLHNSAVIKLVDDHAEISILFQNKIWQVSAPLGWLCVFSNGDDIALPYINIVHSNVINENPNFIFSISITECPYERMGVYNFEEYLKLVEKEITTSFSDNNWKVLKIFNEKLFMSESAFYGSSEASTQQSFSINIPHLNDNACFLKFELNTTADKAQQHLPLLGRIHQDFVNKNFVD